MDDTLSLIISGRVPLRDCISDWMDAKVSFVSHFGSAMIVRQIYSTVYGVPQASVRTRNLYFFLVGNYAYILPLLVNTGGSTYPQDALCNVVHNR